jgi:PAS domain S-box-containing protein
MKVDRKTKAEKSPPATKAVKSGGRRASRTNGKHTLAAYEHISVGIVEASLDGKYMDVNEEFCRILGYSRQELLRLGIKDCTHEDDYGIDNKLHDQLIAGKIPFYKLEKRIVRKSGEIIWVELTRTLVCDTKGKPLYTVGVVLDISDRKDVEKVLRESVERLRLATEAAQIFMWEWDFESQTYTLADNFEQVLGFSAGLLPKNSFETVWALSPQEDVQRISEEFERAVENQSDFHSLPYRVINPENDQTVWLEINAKIVYGHEGKPQRMFGVAQNITKSKQAQDQIAIISRMPAENPNPVMRLTLDGNVLYANLAGAALVEDWKQGTERARAIPQELQTAITAAFTSGLKTEVEIEHRGKVFSCTLAPIVEAGYVNLYASDITKRKQAEEWERLSAANLLAAAEANAKFRTFFDQGSYFAGLMTLDGTIVEANRLCLEFCGFTREEVIGKKFWDCGWWNPSPALIEMVRRGTAEAAEGRLFRTESTYYMADRSERYVDLIIAPVKDETGKLLFLAPTGTDITERKRMENAIRESEERFRAIVSQATAGISESDLDSRLVFVNPRFCEMLGYSEEEMLGRTLWELTYKDDLEENKRLFKRMITQEESYQFEKRFLRKDGSTLWTNVSVSTIRDLNGNAKGGVGVVIDIEERKRAEEALTEFARQQEALYKLSDQLHRTDSITDVCDAALDAISSALQCERASVLLFDDRDVMRFVAWRGLSDSYRKATDGHSPWKIDAKDPEPICMDDVRTAELDESLREVILNEGIGSLAFIPLVSNGKLIGKFMVYFDTAHAFSDGEIDLSLTIAHQLAFGIDRKHAGQQLRESEERFRTLANAMPSIVWTAAPDGTITYANDQWFRYVGITPEQNATYWPELVLHPDDYERCMQVWTRALETAPDEYVVEVRNRRYDGEYRWFQTRAVPARDASGKAIAWYGVTTDIHDRIEAEKRLVLLAEISEMLRNFEDPNELMYTISKAVGEHLHVKRVLFNEIDLKNDREVVHRDYYNGLESAAGFHKVSDYSSMTSAEVASGKTVVNFDSKIDPRTAQDYEKTYAMSGERSYVVVPMMRDNRWVASLWVSDDAPRSWSRDEVSVIETIAERTWTVIEKLRINMELRQSEERFRQAANASGALVYEVDLLSGTSAVVYGVERLVGYDPQETATSSDWWHSLIHPDDLPAHFLQLEELLQRGGTDVCEYRVRRKNGGWIIVQDNRLVVRHDEGHSVRLVGAVIDITERKRAEESLRASESLYRAIARNIPGGGVYVVDKDFRYIVAEGPVTEAFGLTREMLEGHTVMEVFPGEQGEQMEERLRRNFAGETVSFETEHNGRIYWTQQAPLLDSIGQAIILTIDITERKQAEEALRQSEERFAQFMHHLPGLAWIKDMQGRYVYANAAAEQVFKTPREKLYGSTDEAIFDPEVAAQFRRNDEQALRDEKGVQVIETLEYADGVLHSSLVNKFPIPGPDGSTTLIGGTAFDVTERLRAEEALRESEERFRALLRQATAGIVRKDAEGRFIFVNQAFCNMLGYTEAELLGKTLWDFMHEDDVAENKWLYHRLMREGVPFNLERRLLREDGSVIWVDASVSPIMDATGKPQSVVTVEVDITRRKKAEEALQQLNLQLEERVQSRTAKLRAVNQTLREEITERQRVEEALRQSEATARENEKKLSTLFELLPVGISFIDLEGQIIQMNSALTNILKLSKERLANQGYRSRTYIRSNGTLMPPAEFASHRALAEGKTIYNVETGVLLENSEVIWTSVSAAPVDVADVGAAVVTVDITERKHAERALQESRERLQILSQRLVEVQEDERRAIARELHDRVGQTLAALNINLIIISGQLVGKVEEQVNTRLSDAMKLVAETISLVRDVMSNLRPSVLDDYGLEAAIESYLSQFASRYEIQAKLEKPDHPIARLSPTIEMTFLRIAQEALMNVARHAKASQVNLSLRRSGNAVYMNVQDNGTGIESWQDANRPGSHGLTIMRERAEAFGGNLRVSSIPGKGTRIDVSIPVENDASPQSQKEMH